MNDLDSKSMGDIKYETIPKEVVYYEKQGDRYIGNFSLPILELEKVRALLNRPNDDPIIFVFPITTPEQIAFFEEILDCKFNVDSYDYFLETA